MTKKRTILVRRGEVAIKLDAYAAERLRLSQRIVAAIDHLVTHLVRKAS